MTNSLYKRLGRAAALGLSAVVASSIGLVGVAPASAAPADYAVSGTVNTASDDGLVALEGVDVSITIPETVESSPIHLSDTSAADGTFTVGTVEPGTYTLAFALEGYDPTSVEVTVVDGDVTLAAPVTMVATAAPVAAGTVSISGTPVVGNVLTAVTAGWPTGTTLSYEWFYSCGQCGGAFDGETASTYTVKNNAINYWVGVGVTGSLPGHSDTRVTAILDTQASAPKQAPAPAPSDLNAYLQANGSTPLSQGAAGLPAGSLDPGATQTATLEWFSQDSYVDVYVYSTPVLVGTFPVVNGAVQVTLTPAVLAQLATGSHTLVVTGQSSGAVVSVALAIGLAATGAEVALPVSIASGMVLLGAALVFVRRRVNATV